MASTFVDIRELAEHFKVSVSLARTWIKNGVIPPSAYIKITGTYRFDLEKAEAAVVAASEAGGGETVNTTTKSTMENDNE
jgi:predicted site-specific integrase-resolvase